MITIAFGRSNVPAGYRCGRTSPMLTERLFRSMLLHADPARRDDLWNLLRHDLAGLGRADRGRLMRGYLGPDAAVPARKALLSALLSG